MPGRAWRLERLGEVKRRGVKGILRRDPRREERAGQAQQRQERRHQGDRRAAQAPRQVVVPRTAKENQSSFAKRASGRSSARCSVVTLFFIAQGRSWWCSGT